MQNKAIKNRISSGLSHFGLNPSEWSFEKNINQEDPVIVFKNKNDRNFQLVGKLSSKSRKPQLMELELFSV